MTMHLPATRADLVVPFLASFVLIVCGIGSGTGRFAVCRGVGGLTLWSEQACLVRPVMRVLNHLSGLSACDDALTSYWS